MLQRSARRSICPHISFARASAKDERTGDVPRAGASRPGESSAASSPQPGKWTFGYSEVRRGRIPRLSALARAAALPPTSEQTNAESMVKIDKGDGKAVNGLNADLARGRD